MDILYFALNENEYCSTENYWYNNPKRRFKGCQLGCPRRGSPDNQCSIVLDLPKSSNNHIITVAEKDCIMYITDLYNFYIT